MYGRLVSICGGGQQNTWLAWGRDLDMPRKQKRHGNKPELISATELASYAYCPEQFRLQYRLGLEPENRAALGAGTRHHARKALAERIAGGLVLLGGAMMLLAGLVLMWVLFR